MAMDGERVFDLSLHLSQSRVPWDETSPPDLLILNQPISDFAVFARLWSRSKYRLCADGGANRLHDMFTGDLEARRADYIPNAIHGDLDSLRTDVRAYYIAHGAEVSQDPDQYSTDFGKAMIKLSANHPAASPREVFVLGTLAGRVDQGLGMLHELIREERKDSWLRLWLYSETNLSFILRDNRNIIKHALSSGHFTENVGILPIYGPATLSTSGLEWDVQSWESQMGHKVSTSNHVKADEIRIHTNAPVLFTIERASMSGRDALPAQ